MTDSFLPYLEVRLRPPPLCPSVIHVDIAMIACFATMEERAKAKGSIPFFESPASLVYLDSFGFPISSSTATFSIFLASFKKSLGHFLT